MPFYARHIPPLRSGSGPQQPRGAGDDCDSAANASLTDALRQLSSLVLAADDMFEELHDGFVAISDRAQALQHRVEHVRRKVHQLRSTDSPIPEGDLCAFSRRRDHFSSHREPPERDLFTTDTRPSAVRRLYRRALLSPVTVLRQLDAFRSDGLRSSKFFTCAPTSRPALEDTLDIETRRPGALDLLADWSGDEEQLTSPVHPDARLGPLGPRTLEEAAGRRLPSPDRVTRARCRRFPAQLVPVDVTGDGFERQLQFRRSLVQYEYVKRKRKRRSKQRRYTISDSSDLTEPTDTPTTGSAAEGARARRHISTDDQETQTEWWSRPGASARASRAAAEQSPPRAAMADVQLARVDGSAPLGRPGKLSSPERPGHMSGAGWPSSAAVRRRPAASSPAANTGAAGSEASSSGRGSSGGSDLASADQDARVVSPADSGTAVSPCAEERLGSPGRRPASPADSGLSDGGGRADESGSDHTVTPEYGDGDASSVFSCDAEGYYTSFHIDSGLRGAVPPPPPARPDSRTSTLSAGSGGAAPRYRPPPPPRASSLDSRRREATSTPAGTGASRALSPGGGSQLSGSETDGGERFRSKTALTSGRIPSLCVVTPPASEDGNDSSPGRRRDASEGADSDRERTPRPGDATAHVPAHVTPQVTALPPKAPWGGPLSDWTGSETGDSSGEARTPPLVRPEAEGEERSGVKTRTSPDADSSDRLNGSGESWRSSSNSLLSAAELPRQMAALAVSPSRPAARYASSHETPVYDAPVPVRHAAEPQYRHPAYPYPYQGRPGSYSAPASPLTGPRALTGPRHSPQPPETADRRPTDAGVRCAAEPAAVRRASVAGTTATPSSPPWVPAEEVARRVSEPPEASPVLSRAGSLDRRAVRRYTAAAAARIYSSLRLLRGKKDGTAAGSEPSPQYQSPPPQQSNDATPETDRRVPDPGTPPGQYQYGVPAGSALPQRNGADPESLYQSPARAQQQQQQQQPMFRHPSPMPQQRRPPEQRYTLRQYAQLVASYRQQQQQQELYQQYQQQQQQQQQQGQQQGAVRQMSSPQVSQRVPQPWQAEGHYQTPPLWPRQTWVPSPTPDSARQEMERRASLSRHLQTLAQSRHPPHASAAPPPPTGRPLPAVPERGPGDPQAPPSASSPAAAAAVQQSPRPKSRSPFSFGRYSLRVRGSEPLVPEPRRSAEAEQLPPSPERQQQAAQQPAGPTAGPPADDSQKAKRHKKRWFFTLPGKSKSKDKRKSKTDESSDDDGGFAAPLGVAGGGGGGGSSFVRYETPDSVSSGVSSRASTPLTDASVSSSYFEMEQYFPSLNTSQGSGPVPRPLSSLSEDSRSLRGQSSPQLRAPRAPNFSQMEYSPPAAAAAAAAEWRRQGPGAPVMQSPRLAGRQGPLPPPPVQAGARTPQSPRTAQGQHRQWVNHPGRPLPGATHGGGAGQIYGSPTVFARPMAAPAAGRGWPQTASPRLSEPGQRASWAAGSASPRAAAPGQRSSWSGGPAPRAPAGRAASPLTRPTPLNDFKELIARQRSPAGAGPGRGSATERLRAAAAAATASPPPGPAPQSPLDARNSARAVLFQNRFSGRRGRPAGTSVMASTIPETEDEMIEESPPPPAPAPAPASRRQLFPAAADGRSSSSSGSSPDQTAATGAAAMRMSPSSPPPPYSAPADGRLLQSGLASDLHFTPVTAAASATGGFRRSYSLPRHGDQRPPIGSISRYQFQGRPSAALASTADSPFQRSRSLMARPPSSSEQPAASGVGQSKAKTRSPPSPRVETTI